MGTVLHRITCLPFEMRRFRFSPLLDGDGVASLFLQNTYVSFCMFQSPSRWGRCCIASRFSRHSCRHTSFQSPSRWGRCCIRLVDGRIDQILRFQSPSRWGRCCISLNIIDAGGSVSVSVPFSMGTVLHRRERLDPADGSGVSVPFSMGTVLHRARRTCLPCWSKRFSPLLDGDGVASSTKP